MCACREVAECIHPAVPAQEEAPSHIAPWARSELVFREEYPEFQVGGRKRERARARGPQSDCNHGYHTAGCMNVCQKQMRRSTCLYHIGWRYSL
jgi:hypothetical protein